MALLEDESISEIFVGGDGRVEVRRGASRDALDFPRLEHREVARLARKLAEDLGGALTPSCRSLSGDLPSGLQVQVVSKHGAPGGPLIIMRRPPLVTATIAELAEQDRIDPLAAEVIDRGIRSELSMVFVGPRGTGKTTLFAAAVESWARTARVALLGPALRWPDGVPDTVIPLHRDVGVDAAVGLGAACIAVDEPSSDVLASLLLLGRPFVATIEAGSMAAGLRRLIAHVLYARSGMAFGGAESLAASALDLVVETGPDRRILTFGEPQVWARELAVRTLGKRDDDGAMQLQLRGSSLVRRLGALADPLIEDDDPELAPPVSTPHETGAVAAPMLGAALVRGASDVGELRPEDLLSGSFVDELQEDHLEPEVEAVEPEAPLAVDDEHDAPEEVEEATRAEIPGVEDDDDDDDDGMATSESRRVSKLHRPMVDLASAEFHEPVVDLSQPAELPLAVVRPVSLATDVMADVDLLRRSAPERTPTEIGESVPRTVESQPALHDASEHENEDEPRVPLSPFEPSGPLGSGGRMGPENAAIAGAATIGFDLDDVTRQAGEDEMVSSGGLKMDDALSAALADAVADADAHPERASSYEEARDAFVRMTEGRDDDDGDDALADAALADHGLADDEAEDDDRPFDEETPFSSLVEEEEPDEINQTLVLAPDATGVLANPFDGSEVEPLSADSLVDDDDDEFDEDFDRELTMDAPLADAFGLDEAPTTEGVRSDPPSSDGSRVRRRPRSKRVRR